jgi:serine/threonine protein kinase
VCPADGRARGAATQSSRSLSCLVRASVRRCQICDFGVACESRLGELVHEDHGPVGKLKYMAPEVFARHAYDPRKADVWSCGVILFIMLVSS